MPHYPGHVDPEEAEDWYESQDWSFGGGGFSGGGFSGGGFDLSFGTDLDLDIGAGFESYTTPSENTTNIGISLGRAFSPQTMSQQDVGIATSAVGMMKELNRMLEGYKQKKTLIQTATRQKSIYAIDRFDGGINLNKAPRDLSYWEACQMDCMSPTKIGRLIKLGDFATQISASSGDGLDAFMADDAAVIENYGLHYFKWSDSIAANESLAGETPTKYIATMDAGDINIWNLENSVGTNDTTTDDLITSMHANTKAVYHDGPNRLYVSDASFSSSKTYMCGIVDRRKLFPFDDSGTLTYNLTADSHLFKDEFLYHSPPTNGLADGNIMVTGTQADSTQIASLTRLMNTAASSGGTQHHGIYMNVNFEDITTGISSTGWGGIGSGQSKYYKIYASFLYDDGSETKLTDVTSNDNAVGDDVIKATTTAAGIYQKLVIKQCIIDGAGIVASTAIDSGSRIHGARFYYIEVSDGGDALGGDKYRFAELDFKYGLKLESEIGHWNQFEDDNDGSGHSLTTAIQVLGAANANDDTSADGTLSIDAPPILFTYYAQNLYYPEEIKDDLLWKTSTMGNGVAFIANLKYDGRQYTDTTIYSAAGKESGSVYPMWGTFPVDSNRIDIPSATGEITALKWDSDKLFQFRENTMYMINVEDVTSPRVEGVYQGMGVSGQYAITDTPYGIAWINANGAYQYNAEEKKVRSLTIGRLDAGDFGADSTSKIGYDDRAKMLIITSTTQTGTNGYHYAYSFITDAWCTWNANKAHAANVKTNFAIDHDGYLTGAIDDDTALDVYRWNASASAVGTIEYITKDIDMGKPGLDKRLYTLYISYTGGTSQDSMFVYFRINGMEGTDLTNGWTKLGTIYDYTNPYGTNQGSAWGTSADGSTTLSGEAFVPSSVDDLDSVDTGDVQKLAKINLRHLGNSVTLPDDYLKFARSIQFKISGTAATTFEINDISLVFKDKRIK